jgi:hypothetical protein
MEIDTDPEFELPDDHYVAQELTDRERVLYCSVAEQLEEGIETLAQHRGDKELSLNTTELSEIADSVENASLLCALITEVAVWRKRETAIPGEFGQRLEEKRVDVEIEPNPGESDE